MLGLLSNALGIGLFNLTRVVCKEIHQAQAQKQIAEEWQTREAESGQTLVRLAKSLLPIWGYSCIKESADKLVYSTVGKVNERMLTFSHGNTGWTCTKHNFADKYSWIRFYFLSNSLSDSDMQFEIMALAKE